MTIDFSVSEEFACSPAIIFQAWLSSAGHTQMTGSPATASDQAGEPFKAWDGYILGKNLELDPNRRILQAWRTSEFDADQPDSIVEIKLDPSGEGTRVTIRHWNLPEDGMQYRQGWEEFYFAPMKAFLEGAEPAA
jgi:activator of HSP90 ATPase